MHVHTHTHTAYLWRYPSSNKHDQCPDFGVDTIPHEKEPPLLREMVSKSGKVDEEPNISLANVRKCSENDRDIAKKHKSRSEGLING